jgi:uncharacterized RDD family membrane protein YckC
MDDESTTGAPAGLFRRLAALSYDLLLVAALLVAAGFAMLPLSHGQAVTTAAEGALGYAYHAVLLIVAFSYFGWCWTRTGQSLGMRVWRIRLLGPRGETLDWPAAAGRYLLGVGMAYLAVFGGWYLPQAEGWLATMGAAAMLGPVLFNFGWIPFDRERRSLMDLAGRTHVRRVG